MVLVRSASRDSERTSTAGTCVPRFSRGTAAPILAFMRRDPILIVGAGIGGLSCAAALARAGFEVRVLEQADALGEVGAGLGLWTNAVRCLTRLGVPEALWERGCAVRCGEVATHTGTVLSAIDVGRIADVYGAQSYVVHRADLHAALAELVDPSAITVGARCVGLDEDGDGVTVRLADGSEARGSLVVGADGLRSAVRASILGEAPPRYSGETCYRGVADFRAADPHMLREVQGRGLRCAVCALGPSRVYWWATERGPEGHEDDPSARKAHLAAAFEGFAFDFPDALAATDPAAILKNDLYDRPPARSWSRGRVTLLGDAAHPTTPNLGQGACMAIEDAIVLSRALAAHPGDHAAAFAAYERARMPRTSRIVSQSRSMGRIGSMKSPIAVAMRNLAFRLTPGFVMDRAMRAQIGYDADAAVV